MRSTTLMVLLIVVASCKPYFYKPEITALDGETKKIPVMGAIAMLYNKDSLLLDTLYTDSTGVVKFDSISDCKIFINMYKDGYVSNDEWWPTKDFRKSPKHTYYMYKSKKDTANTTNKR